MFFPGYFLILAIFGTKDFPISRLERFVLSFGLGLTVTNFIAFSFSRLEIEVTALSSTIGISLFSLICFLIFAKRFNFFQKITEKKDVRKSAEGFLEVNRDGLFNFSKKELLLIFVLIFLMIFIKTAYLSGSVAPTSTDMGHHLYWTKMMAESHILPNYEGMPDFIIGEHIVLAIITMISGLDLFGALPVVFLFLLNTLGILTVFLLVLRIFKKRKIAILSLLFLGVLFAVSSPQAKFISGGVIGNIFGNFLMPLAFYFYFRAFSVLTDEQKDLNNSKNFLALAIFVTFGLFYTHHLTAFIFLFVFPAAIAFYLLTNYKEIKLILTRAFQIILSCPVILTFLLGLFFFFFVFTPTYFQNNAAGTAIGTPSKATREGLTLVNIKSTVGEARLALGIVGFLIFALAYRRKNFGYALVFSWSAMLFIMSFEPKILFINLPSNRIGNYMTYPIAILGAFGLYGLFKLNRLEIERLKLTQSITELVPGKFLKSAFLLIIIYAIGSGVSDSAKAFKKAADYTPTLETFDASRYLVKNSTPDEMILKDHNYLTGDTWMKLFLMRGYLYPLSRSYFKRYEDETKPREMCTLYMISNPAGLDAKDCFSKTKTKFIVLNPRYDSSQFRKLDDFDSVYNSGGVAVYYKNTD
jgi:hypothetical protein